jgi:hypothetical protein
MVQTVVPSIASTMPDATHSFADRLAALAFLGQSRYLEWQALYAQTTLIEWSRTRREWQHQQQWVAGSNALPYEPIWNFTDVATIWAMSAARSQLAAAQGLLAHCALPYLELANASGRRQRAFDLGRRSSAVVINFPDRRHPEPIN